MPCPGVAQAGRSGVLVGCVQEQGRGWGPGAAFYQQRVWGRDGWGLCGFVEHHVRVSVRASWRRGQRKRVYHAQKGARTLGFCERSRSEAAESKPNAGKACGGALVSPRLAQEGTTNFMREGNSEGLEAGRCRVCTLVGQHT